jgi:hypothetical protein
MTIADYLNQPNKLQFLQEIIAQAKLKNQSNPALLLRTDEYVALRQEQQF